MADKQPMPETKRMRFEADNDVAGTPQQPQQGGQQPQQPQPPQQQPQQGGQQAPAPGSTSGGA